MHLAQESHPSQPPPAAEPVAGEAISDHDRWYVTNGVTAVGPVAYELLTRGVASGRIPSWSFVRHQSWKVWRRLDDIEQLSASKR